jgi:hypothetical protein
MSDKEIRIKILKKKYPFFKYSFKKNVIFFNLFLSFIFFVPLLSLSVEVNPLTISTSVFLSICYSFIIFTSDGLLIFKLEKIKENFIEISSMIVIYSIFIAISVIFKYLFLPYIYFLIIFIYITITNYRYDYLEGNTHEVEKYEIRDWKLNKIRKKNKSKKW